jgi:hypothetical protein
LQRVKRAAATGVLENSSDPRPASGENSTASLCKFARFPPKQGVA